MRSQYRCRRRTFYLSLPGIVEETDLLATVPLATGARFAKLGTVELGRLPFKPPSFSVQQNWHRLYHHDPRSLWLRACIAELFNEASDEWSRSRQSFMVARCDSGRRQRECAKPLGQ
jgi:hypothetical protein